MTRPSGVEAVAEQFDDPEQQRDTASLGMWTFLVSEVLFFGALFATYFLYRAFHHAEFVRDGQDEDVVIGAANTCVLLTSSLAIALGTHWLEQDVRPRLRRWMFALTVLLGLVFLSVKAFEWHEKFQ